MNPAMYDCPRCGHMPAEHGPDGCIASVNLAIATSPNPAVRWGHVAPSGYDGARCGCRAMVNGELVGRVTSPGQLVTTTQGEQQMGVMDQINQEVGPISGGSYATAEIKGRLWVNRVPFEITAAPYRKQKPQQFMKPKENGSMPADYQWMVPIRLLSPRADGSFSYELQPDGEGGQETVDHILPFDGGSDYRDQQMNAIGRYVQAHGSAGPLKLTKGEARSGGNPPWILDDWKVADGPFGASGAAASPAASVTPSASAPSPADDPSYTYQTRPEDGKRFRWKEGMATWEPVPEAPQPPPFPVAPAGPPPLPGTAASPSPPSAPAASHLTVEQVQDIVEPGVRHAQPIPATSLVKGYINTPGITPGAAHSVPVTVEQTTGPVRQAVYQGDGVVSQPSGVDTLNASGTEPRSRQEAGGMGPALAPETAGTVEGGLGVEGGAPAPPGPPGASQQASLRQAYENGTTIAVTANCDACLQPISSPAFYNPGNPEKGVPAGWLQMHTCPSLKRTRNLNVTNEVKQLVGVS